MPDLVSPTQDRGWLAPALQRGGYVIDALDAVDACDLGQPVRVGLRKADVGLVTSVVMNVCSIIEDAGFETLEAGDADDALLVMESYHAAVPLLFTDVEMPNSRNGFALAREVAQRWPHVGILVASGHVKPDPDAMPDGAIFISKLFSAEVVHTRVREILPDGRKPKPLK